MENKWTTGEKTNTCEDCSYVEQFTSPRIRITPEINSIIEKLCKTIKKEWQMLLCGKIEKDGDVIAKDYYIPKQQISSASVKNIDCINQKFIDDNKVVATIHSHADMNVFFSTTDDEFTNLSPISYHIVCNNNGEFKACAKVALPCKLVKLVKCNVSVLYKVKEVDIKGIENIEEEKYVGYGYEYKDNKQLQLYDDDEFYTNEVYGYPGYQPRR